MTDVQRENDTGAPRQPSHVRSLIDDHFRLRGSPANERRMRIHMSECDACKTHYANHMRIASVDPAAPDPMRRLAVGLGLRPRQRPALVWYGIPTTAIAMAALIAVFALPDERNSPLAQGGAPTLTDPAHELQQAGLVARGGDDHGAGLIVYRVRGDDATPIEADEPIAANEELAFAYRNERGNLHMLVFGVDGAGSVHWYFPAWQDPTVAPMAISIQSGDEPHRLADAVRHPLAGAQVEIFAVFTDIPLTVRDIEAWAERERQSGAKLGAGPLGPSGGPSDFVWSRTFRLEHP